MRTAKPKAPKGRNVKAPKGRNPSAQGNALGKNATPSPDAWISVRAQMPDADLVVMIACSTGDEPVWMGFHDGDAWRAVDASLVGRVTHWKNLPEPPRAKRANLNAK